MSTADEQDRPANVREEIAARVARFKATQEKFAREREAFYAATMERALNDKAKPKSVISKRRH
jgi:hypothetical protein